MTGLMIFLGICFLIGMIPLGVSVVYDEDGTVVRVIAGPLKLLVFPRPKKAKKETPPKPAAEEAKKEQKAKKSKQTDDIPDGPPDGAPSKKLPKPKQGGSMLDFIPLVDVAVDMLSGLGRRLRVNTLQLRLTMAGDDPCDLAVNYGKAQAAGAALLAQLDRFLVIKHQDVEIQCDFVADEMKILARLDLTITIGRILSLGVVYGFRGLITFLKINKQRKGGASL